jgi:hypothetical protein
MRMVHVFWDVSSCHPAGDDPRAVVAQLKRVLRCYGQLAGIYAYAVPKMFRWVPESFMLQYAPQRLPGAAGWQVAQQCDGMSQLGVVCSWEGAASRFCCCVNNAWQWQ